MQDLESKYNLIVLIILCRTFLCLPTKLFKELPNESFACTNHKFNPLVPEYFKKFIHDQSKAIPDFFKACLTTYRFQTRLAIENLFTVNRCKRPSNSPVVKMALTGGRRSLCKCQVEKATLGGCAAVSRIARVRFLQQLGKSFKCTKINFYLRQVVAHDTKATSAIARNIAR